MPSTPQSISNDDLPALYRVADKDSLDGQKTYLRLIRADLAVLIGGAVFAAFSFQNETVNQWLLVISAIFLATGAVITLVLSQKRFRKSWYGGRATAESIKTLAWRYMMRAEPFDVDTSFEGVDRRFTQHLRDLLVETERFSVSLDPNLTSGPQISRKMREVRLLPLDERKKVYISDRIHDQRLWYGRKSAINASREDMWFWLVVGAQLLALTAAIIMIVFPAFWLNPTGILATVAAAAFAWLQVKQHEELAQSYSVAAHELGLIVEESKYVNDQDRFSSFVGDAETAISREHTLWLARRDQPLALHSGT